MRAVTISCQCVHVWLEEGIVVDELKFFTPNMEKISGKRSIKKT